MATTPDLYGFARLVTALDPWLDQIVIIGGWAHRLYRFDPRAQKLEFAPLTTLDADIALPPKLPGRAPSIRELLLEMDSRRTSEATTSPRNSLIIEV